jgi:hypothetical protein
MSTPLTSAEIMEKILRAAEKATLRPWWADHDDRSVLPDVPILADCGDHGLLVAQARGDETAEYIALAGNHAPDLIAEIRRLEAERKRLEDMLAVEMRHNGNWREFHSGGS